MFTISTFCIYLFLQTYCFRLISQLIQIFKHDSWYYNKSTISIARRDTRVFKNKISNRSSFSWETNDEKFFWRDKRRNREITNRIFTQTTKFLTIKNDETTTTVKNNILKDVRSLIVNSTKKFRNIYDNAMMTNDLSLNDKHVFISNFVIDSRQTDLRFVVDRFLTICLNQNKRHRFDVNNVF